MYVTDVPVVDRITDPVLSAAEDLDTLASELDMALYDPDFAERAPGTISDHISEAVSDLLDTLLRRHR